MLTYGARNILQTYIDQAINEIAKAGKANDRTLLELAFMMVRWNPNYFTSSSCPSYSEDEKTEAVKLLKASGFGKYCVFSSRKKKVILDAINAQLKVLEVEA
jgi:hypothetical protein